MDAWTLPPGPKTLAVALLAGLLSLSTVGRAAGDDARGQDEVTLKNGGTIRGTVVSSEPGTSVKIIELGDTQARVIPWSQVSDVEKGKYAPRTDVQPGSAGLGYASAPPPPVAAPPAPEPKMGDPGVVRLHIDSPRPATVIEQRSALVGAYGGYGVVLAGERTVCTSPCDAVVDGSGGRVFRLASDAYPEPGPFGFTGMKGDVTMHLAPGSTGRRVGGVLAIVFGSIAVLTGAVLLPVGLDSTTTDENTGVTVKVPSSRATSAGAGLLGGGIAAIVGGSVLFVTGATKMSLEPRSAAPAKTARIEPRYWMGEF